MWEVTESNRLSTMKMNSPKRKSRESEIKRNVNNTWFYVTNFTRTAQKFPNWSFFSIKQREINSMKSAHRKILIWESGDRLGTSPTRIAAKVACQTDFSQKFASLLNCMLSHPPIMQPQDLDLSFNRLAPLEVPILCAALQISSPGVFRFANCS